MATVNYDVKDNWGSGFVGNMTVAAGTTGLRGWTVEFDAAFDISNLWGAEIVSRVGNHYVVRNAAWNADVPAGGTVAFGFQATPGSSGGTTATGLSLSGGGTVPVLPTLSVSDATVTEGQTGTAQLSFTVSLSQAATGPVTVNYATANGTATAGQDYTAKTGTITFAAGETTKTIQIAVNGDTAVEANETLTLALSGATGATIADGSATGTIVNDDVTTPTPGNASLDYDVTSNWGSGFTGAMKIEAGSAALNGWTAEFNASFTITNIWNAEIVSHVGDHYVIRNVAWNGKVGAGDDVSFGFQATPGSTGTTATGFTINGVATGGPTPVLPTLSVSDATTVEGNSGVRDLAFIVSLSAAATGPVTVAYATANGTATAGSDYAAVSGTLTFAAGETSKIIHVQVSGDSAVEANEQFTLALSSPSGATIADGSAVGTITNDDVAPVLPTLSVGDASVAEGNNGLQDLAFTVTLSAPATGAVTVAYATGNGTATAGSDYSALAGTLTFAAGETSKVVHVQVSGDTAVEANETLTLTLSSPTGATIADGSAIGTIVNDDVVVPTLPTLSVADTSVVEGDPGQSGGGAGWFSTSGNQIIDSAGHSVQIAGVNWFGFETALGVPHGLYTRGYQDMMNQMVDLGFNTIRLPYSSDMLHSTATSFNINYSKSPDLQGLTALQIMDKIVDYAGQIGLKIILDHHRSTPGDGPSSNGLWYDAQHSEASWIADWQMLATRYGDDPTVIGADLHNEPYNGVWGGGGANDWAAAAERAGNAIGDVNPNWLIFVEGVGSYQGQPYWWGGNLMGVRDRPVELDVANKLVYSPHDYPNSVYAQPWFQGPAFPANLPAKFDQMWGYIFKEGIAPIYIGEFGTGLTDPKDAPWFEAITSYLSGDLDNNGTSDLAPGQKGASWTFWSWNPNSGDTGGILNNDWSIPNQAKLAYLTPIQFEFHDGEAGGGDGGPATTNHASFLVSLSEPATHAVTVDYHTEIGDAGAADFTGSSGSITFAAGEQSKTISIAITPDTLDEANEHFSLVLTNAQGATIARATATATIVDDDATATPPVTPTPTPPTTPPTTGDLEALFAVVNSWSGGFQGSVTLDNEGANATNGWQVRIDTTNVITDIWNAEIVSHDANGYVVKNAAWNGTIAHDGEASFGFVTAGSMNPLAVHVDLYA